LTELHTVFFRGNYRRNEAGIFFLHAFFINKSIGNNIFLLPTSLPTNKKLPIKDSLTEHFSFVIPSLINCQQNDNTNIDGKFCW